MSHRRNLSIEEQRVRLSRIIELRDKQKLNWKQIGARLGFSSTYVSTMYRRYKAQQGVTLRTEEQIIKEFKETKVHYDTPFSEAYKLLQRRQFLIMEMLQVLSKEIRKGK